MEPNWGQSLLRTTRPRSSFPRRGPCGRHLTAALHLQLLRAFEIQEKSVTIDLLIRNGFVIDGSWETRPDCGPRGFRREDRRRRGGLWSATRVMDADGLVVAPGFIDVHTHYDAQAFWDPMLTPSSLHGVTTIVGGNCGFSIAPLSPHSSEYVPRMLARRGMPISRCLLVSLGTGHRRASFFNASIASSLSTAPG